MGFPNVTTGVKLRHYDPSRIGSVLVYNAINCQRLSAAFPANSDPYLVADYFLTDVEEMGMHNNIASSVMVPFGYTAIIYDGTARGGDKITVNGPMFRDRNLSMECINLGDSYNFDDRLSSLTVKRTSTLGGATGRWVSMTGSSKLDYEL